MENNASWNNWKNWNRVGCVEYIDIYQDQQHGVYWAWYRNDGYGACEGPFNSLNEAEEVALEMNSRQY